MCVLASMDVMQDLNVLEIDLLSVFPLSCFRLACCLSQYGIPVLCFDLAESLVHVASTGVSPI